VDLTERAAPDPFDVPDMGAVYARGRLFHHRDALERVGDLVGGGTVQRALDVGCGTGVSTVALAEHAAAVVGVDVAAPMLAKALPRRGVTYARALAEALPFGPASFDAAIVSSALHWFDRDRCFAELRRVLRPGGWVAAYEYALAGDPAHGPELGAWLRDVYQRRYPSPTWAPLLAADIPHPVGFEQAGEAHWTDLLPLDHDALVDHLRTSSGAIEAVALGRESAADVQAWLAEQTAPWIASRGAVPLAFRGTIVAWRARG
jgi:SAM-dependent methyltransferase